jgi:hypothetical protein
MNQTPLSLNKKIMTFCFILKVAVVKLRKIIYIQIKSQMKKISFIVLVKKQQNKILIKISIITIHMVISTISTTITIKTTLYLKKNHLINTNIRGNNLQIK